MAVAKSLFHDVSAGGRCVVPEKASMLLDRMISNGKLPKGYTRENLPCALTAFAAAFSSERHIECFYWNLVEQGLEERDEQGRSGGICLAKMLRALNKWESWAAWDARERKVEFRGLDVYRLKCKGGTLLEYHPMLTRHTEGHRRQSIIFIDDVDSPRAHYCAAGAVRKTAGRVLQAMRNRAGYADQVSADPAEVTEEAPEHEAETACDAVVLEPAAASEAPVDPGCAGPSTAPTTGSVESPNSPGDIIHMDEPGPSEQVPTMEERVTGQGPGHGTEPSGLMMPAKYVRYLHRNVEFVKTHNIAPTLDFDYTEDEIERIARMSVSGGRRGMDHVPMTCGRLRARAYACGDLVPEGCVAHTDPQYEGGIGLTELHPEVLNRFNFTRNSFYYVSRGVGPDPLNPVLLSNGQYNPGWIASVQFGNMSYILTFIGHHGTCSYYRMKMAAHNVPRKGIFSCPRFLREACEEVGAWASANGLARQPKACVKHATNLPGRELEPKSLTGFAGAKRAEWALTAQYAREDLRGAYHTLFIENADDQSLNPKAALLGLRSQKGTLESEFGKKGYCTPALSDPKRCASCGKAPPKTKYKWKHRECNDCQDKLKKCGAVSTMGLQIQQNLTVAEGHPGRVHLNSSTLPPKASKWDKVDIPKGAITMHRSEVPWLRNSKKSRVPEAGRLYEVEKGDLAKIDTSLERPKRECVLAGIGVSGCYPMVTRKGLYSRMQALIGRAFLAKPESSPAAWAVMDTFKEVLLHPRALDGERMTVESWIASMPARRRRALERAYAEYLNHGGLSEKDLTFSAFVKQELLASYEKFNWCEAKPLLESIARMIMAPKDKAHIVAGPIIKPKLERLKKHWGSDNWLFYGATTPENLQGWLDSCIRGCEDGEVFAFWCDYSMFDCTHSAESMRLVEGYYSEMLTDPEFARLITAWRAPRGRMGEMKYRAAIMLASGRDDTSLMNALLNGLVMGLSVAAAVAGVELEDLRMEHLRYAMAYIRISITGDDTLGFLPKHLWPDRARIMRELERNVKRFGLVTKMDCTNYIGSAVYLGMRPYNVPTPLGRRWLWGRTVGRAAFKLGWMLDLAKGDAAAWATGVADSIVRTQPYVPILSDMARQVLLLRKGCKRTPLPVDENKPWTNWTVQAGTKDLTYDRHTLLCLERSYSTPTLYGGTAPICSPTADDFLRTVKAIQAVPCLPYVVDDMALRFMCVTDEC